MKRLVATAACLLVSGLPVHRAIAQRSETRLHTISSDRASSGYLGVGVAEVDEERVKSLKLKDDHGVVVMNVSADSPAAKAGLKESDVILEYNGQRVEGVEQFMRMVRETPAGRKVTLQVTRNGNPQTIAATLAARSSAPKGEYHYDVRLPDMPQAPWGEMPAPLPSMPRVFIPDTPRPIISWRQAVIGIEAEPLRGQLAEFFGVKDGVLVRSVTRNSPAEKAGIKAGDVVVRVASNAVKSPEELSREVRSLRETKSPVTMTLLRNHKELNLTVKLPDSSDSKDEDGDN